MLLLVMFAVTVIQVSHSHTATLSLNGQKNNFLKKSVLPGYTKSTAERESKCFICEYQLAKDVDASHAVVNIIAVLQYQFNTALYYSFTSTGIFSFFETRGPPSVA